MDNKISLAGDLGSGKSTVSAILTERLGAKYYSTGAIVRKIAESRNMTVVELNKYMETHPEIDHEIDAGIAALSEAPESLIIDSRMAWHFTKGTFKVYLSTDIETSAYRIMSANRQGEQAASFEETVANTRARRDSEKKRYLEQYGVNIKDLTNYTLIVDTTVATPTEVADCIERGFRLWQADKSYSEACISPERLNFPDIEPDTELVARLSCMLDRGEAIPTPEVVEADGEFYLVSGLESAMAYSFSMSTYIYARLISGSVPEGEFVKMKNSL
ncbi:MAG: cytidylate kinase family protein [Clostridia bacterium]|nr:cytidylate kinase family protein [Clostridia bacterium]